MGRGCEAEAIALDRSFDKVAVIFILTCYFQSELLLNDDIRTEQSSN